MSVLEEVMPRWSSRERHQVRLRAAPSSGQAVIDAVEALTWQEVPGFYRLIRWVAMGTKAFAPDGQVLKMLLDGPYRVIHRSDEELVIAAVLPLRRDQRRPELGDDPVAAFRALDERGVVKVAGNFFFRDGILSTETRNLPIGPMASALFGLYWLAIRIGSGLIRRAWLAGIRRRVELTMGADARARGSAAPGPR